MVKVWDIFRGNFMNIRAAGGIVRNEDDHILFIYRNGKWDFPKGKIDKDELPDRAACREVSEECGIVNQIIVKELPATWHIYQSHYPKTRGQWILKEIIWFEMLHKGNAKLIPQATEGITRAEWVPRKNFRFQNRIEQRWKNLSKILEDTYPNLEQVIRNYL